MVVVDAALRPGIYLAFLRLLKIAQRFNAGFYAQKNR